MAALKEHVKRFIVIHLARYFTPSQVVDAVNDEFGIKVTRMQVQSYDPTKSQGKALSKKYVDLFNENRQKFRDEEAEIPLLSKNYRVQMLQMCLNKEISMGNIVQAKATIEQAAKEQYGFYEKNAKHEEDHRTPLFAFYQKICGTSLPVVQDVEGEYEEVKQLKPSNVIEKEPEKITIKPKKKLIGRD